MNPKASPPKNLYIITRLCQRSFSSNFTGYGGSYSSYQIVVTADSGALTGVDITSTDLTSNGNTLHASTSVQLFRQYFIDFSKNLHTGDFGGVLPAPSKSPTNDPNVPDPLIPFKDPYTGIASLRYDSNVKLTRDSLMQELLLAHHSTLQVATNQYGLMYTFHQEHLLEPT